MVNKQTVHQRCILLLRKKQNSLQSTLKDLTASAGNETKSTAGDKHETALAMLQIEQENASRQLNTILTQLTFLESIDFTKPHNIIGNGSFIKTNKGLFYIAVALGKIMVESTQVFILSIQSPLGKNLAGLKKGDTAELNGNNYLIEEVS